VTDHEAFQDARTRPLENSSSSSLPQEIGGYEIAGILGEGGMGIVLRGYDRELRRHVAIKVVRQELTSQESFIERFLREARLSAALNHPNIVHTYRVGRHNGAPYLVFEYVDGKTLRDLLRSTPPLKTSEILRLVRQCCDGLETAARLGIVHRDIKPANIMVRKDGIVKLMDFGLSKEVDAQTMTLGSAIMGTPDYMSPEQAAGKPVDFRTDVYSLGITIFQCVTGYLPYKSSSIVETIRMHAEEPLPMDSRLRSLAGGRLQELIQWMTAKNAIGRPESYEDVRRALDEMAPLVSDEDETPTTKILSSAEDRQAMAKAFVPPIPAQAPGAKRTSSSSRVRAKKKTLSAEKKRRRHVYTVSAGLLLIGGAAAWALYSLPLDDLLPRRKTQQAQPLQSAAVAEPERPLVPVSERNTEEGPVSFTTSRGNVATARDVLENLGSYGSNLYLAPGLRADDIPVAAAFSARTPEHVLAVLCLATGWQAEEKSGLIEVRPGNAPPPQAIRESRAEINESRLPLLGLNTISQPLTVRMMCDKFSHDHEIDYLIVGREVAQAPLPSLSISGSSLENLMLLVDSRVVPIHWTVIDHTLILIPRQTGE